MDLFREPYKDEDFQTILRRTLGDGRAMQKRIVNLEQQVANQALELHKFNGPADPMVRMKSQAAQQQATNGLYAPLRSDTKPLLEMSAFVRTVAAIDPDHASYSMYSVMRELVAQAKEILKRST